MEDKNNKWTIFIIIIIATFMSTLDGSIVNVALPKMADALGVTTSKIQLVVTSYLITISAIILIFGRLGDMFGKTTVFKIGLLMFTFGSFLCGITNSFNVLILARIIQAIGAAGTMANNQGIITEVFPKNERGKALGINGTAVALGSLVGPGLGGFIVGALDWEFIFLINVPIGAIALFYAFKLLPKAKRKNSEKIDVLGALLFFFTIVPLFLSLNEGINLGFTSPIILAGFVIAAICFVFFIALEKKIKEPLMQLDMFKNKLFSISIFCGFVSFVAIFCHNIILPFYLQDLMNFSPQKAGMILMIYPLVLMVVAPISGSLSDKIGSEFLTFIGLIIGSIGLFLMATLSDHSRVIVMVIFIAIMSVGMGIFQSPNNSLVMSTVPKDKFGIAGSINALVRNLGIVSGIALSTTLLYTKMSSKIGYRVTDFVEGRNDAFMYGMKWVYITAGAICLFGAILTFYRMHNDSIDSKEEDAKLREFKYSNDSGN
ncbi:MAG: MFS transporter [Clostridium sp.]